MIRYLIPEAKRFGPSKVDVEKLLLSRNLKSKKMEPLVPSKMENIFSIKVTVGDICWAISLAKAHRGCGRNKARDGYTR
jgi:hypothetical protein